MGSVAIGIRLIHAKWSFLEIDMDRVDGSGNGKMANPGTARGCRYGDKFWLMPNSMWAELAWFTEGVLDKNGDPGLPTDGVRRVFPMAPHCWKYDQSNNKNWNYNHCGSRTSDRESTRGGTTSDESKNNARMEDHLKDSEMGAKADNPWSHI